MHGIPDSERFDSNSGFHLKALNWVHSHRYWLLCVALPTLLVAIYLTTVASSQYESEAHFLVRSGDSSPPAIPSIGAAFGLGGGGSSGSSNMAPVTDYLNSHDAVAALQKRLDIVDRFRRPDADLWSRLKYENPTPEQLLAYYRGQVTVEVDGDNGIASVKVRSFRPADSFEIANALLQLGESRVNSLNQRSYESTLGVARRQMDDAERAVADIQQQITSFRRNQDDFDPQVSGRARVELVTNLQQSLAQARAQLQSMQTSLAAGSPQVIALRAQVRALEAQVAREQGLLSKGKGNVATSLGTYEELQLRQQFASKRYDTAAAALEKAREELIRQQLFVVRVVNPNMPVRATYPRILKSVLTVFVTLALVYGLGWLIAAGMKEHTA